MTYRCEDEALEYEFGLSYSELEGFIMTDPREAERAELLRLEDEPVWIERQAA